MNVPFFKQSSINSKYIGALKTAIDHISNGEHLMVSGFYSLDFESRFSSYLGSKNFVFLSNGLDSLTLALKALDLKPYDEVIVPTHTYIATWIAPLLLGCKLIPVPVREDNFLLDTTLLSDYCTSRTKCIMPVHLYGNACDMEELTDFASAKKIFVVEDAAQAHGVAINNRKIGTYGDITCFSFYPTKNLGAFGEAGGISTDNDELAQKLISMRNYGRSPFDGSKNSYLSGNHRGDEIQAAMLTEKLCDLDVISDKRRQLITLYIELLSPVKDHISLIPYQEESSPHLAIAALSDPRRRQDFIDFMHKSGVQIGIHYKEPCHSQPCIDKALVQIDPFSRNQATIISSKIVSLPLSECHTSNEIKYVASVICRYFQR